MLVDVLHQSGGEGAELLRRWAAALMAAPPAERRGIVEAVERRVVELYHSSAAETETGPMVHVAGSPKQRDGFTEVVVRSFSASNPPADSGMNRKRNRSA